MIYSSLAVLAMAASAAMPFGNLVHLHPRASQPDTRVTILLSNNGDTFRDVKVADHIYTVNRHSTTLIKAPIGTLIYRASPTPFHAKGEVLVALTPDMNQKTIETR